MADAGRRDHRGQLGRLHLGVINSHVVETSLGYFINPLVSVALGVVLLHERLRRLQWFAIGLGTLAVMVLTVDYGRPPWLALLLAGGFGTYGYLKNRAVGAAEGLLVESSMLAVPALAVLAVLGVHGSLTWPGHGADHDLLLMSTGVISVAPLLFFAGAACRCRFRRWDYCSTSRQCCSS